MEKDFYGLMDDIHNKMEKGKSYYDLLSDKTKWNQLCASLYTIEDAQSAISAYSETDFPEDEKGMYLFIYGLLQAFYLQQDAASGLSYSLTGAKINFREDYPALYKIRSIRDDTIGHPTNRNNRKDCKHAYIQISQISINKFGFDYAIYRDVNNYEFELQHVNLQECILEQEKSIIVFLRSLCDYLDEEWKKFIEKFKGKEMKKIFSNLCYAKKNVLSDDILSKAGMESAFTMVEKCKIALNERYGDWHNVDCFKYEINDIYSIKGLIESDIVAANHDLKHFLSELLFVKLERLEKYSDEIDEKFAQDYS